MQPLRVHAVTLLGSCLVPGSAVAQDGLLPAAVGAQVPWLLLVMLLGAIGIYLQMRRRRDKVRAAAALKSARQALEDNERRYNLILDNISAHVYLKDLQGRYLYANRPLRDMLQASPEDIVGSGDERFFDDATVRTLHQNDQRVLQDGEALRSEETILLRGGDDAVTYWSIKLPLRHEDGRIYGLLGISTDITERRRAQYREQLHNQVLEQLASTEPLPAILNSIVRSVEQENPAMLCSILLLDESGKHLKTGASPSLPAFFNDAVDGTAIGSGKGSCGAAAHSRKRVIVEDIASHPFWADYREIAARAGLAACWSEPIIDTHGKVQGTFALYHRRPCAPTARDIALIEHAAKLASIAISRSQAQESLKLAMLVFQNTSEAMMITNADNIIIAINPAFTEQTGYSADEAIGRNPSLLSSGRQSEEFYRNMWNTLNTRDMWQGEICNRRKNGEEYVEWLTINTIYDDAGKVWRRVALFSDITEKKKADELIWLQANYDTLTQLPNRRLFTDRLAQEIKKANRERYLVALLFLDLDRFKAVNDSLGHHVGDELLVMTAQRIQSCVRESDTVARLGGDEFTVIIPRLGDIADAGRVAQNIIDSLGQHFQLGREQLYVSASIGITVFPDDADNVEDLLKNADQAMYAAKHEGRGCYRFYTHSMQESAQQRMRLSRELAQALPQQQLVVHYQPIMELASGHISKAEALLRWKHPQLGFVSPEIFIPLAEDIGIIHEIGNWMFSQATHQLAEWQQKFDPAFQISFNKSPAQFYIENKTHGRWLDIMRAEGLKGASITVEITENLLLHADDAVADQLMKFSRAGIQVAIDDFGTGFSSLASLKKYEVDYLKIDNSFIHELAPDAGELALCEAMIVMAHRLGLSVIAEGVETEEQHRLLCAMGCDYAQGYLYSPPLPADAFEALLRQQGGARAASDGGPSQSVA